MSSRDPFLRSIGVLAARLDCSEEKAKRIAFAVIDHLLSEEPSDEAIGAGLYHNHRANSAENMVKSYKEILWTMYEELADEHG